MKVTSSGVMCIPYAVTKFTSIGPEAKLLYGAISAVLSSEDAVCSDQSLAEDIGVPPEAIMPLVEQLQEAGLLNVRDDGKGTAMMSLAKHPCFDGIEVPEEEE